MEASAKWTAVTAVAPIAWGANYYVTRHILPEGYPLYGALLRALPAGLLLLAITRTSPRGSWWWKSIVLGGLNVGAFFVLVYLSAQLLASSVASTLMSASALVMMLMAWVGLGERPRLLAVLGATVGLSGVSLMLLSDPGTVDPTGVACAIAAMGLSSAGYVLTKRWGGAVPVLALTAWQLIAGGLMVAPIAVTTEGSLPPIGLAALVGYVYVTVVATALAFVAWFAGLRHLKAATVGIVGLLNPVTGVLLGSVAAGEPFGRRQLAGISLVTIGVLVGQRPGRHRTWAQLGSTPIGSVPVAAGSVAFDPGSPR